MLKPEIWQCHTLDSIKTLLPLHKPFLHGSGRALLPLISWPSFNKTTKPLQFSSVLSKIKAIATATATQKSLRVKATVNVKETVADLFTHLGLDRGLDDIQDLLGKSIILELVSMELDPTTGLEKKTIKAFAQRVGHEGEDIKYEAELEVGREFGEVGAVFVENEHHRDREMYVDEIVIHGFPNGPVKVKCASWVHSKFEVSQKRVFFANNKSYLPSETPNGLKRLREEELLTCEAMAWESANVSKGYMIMTCTMIWVTQITVLPIYFIFSLLKLNFGSS